ncbi:hypothetical protein [Alicycliphilus denitrificans]
MTESTVEELRRQLAAAEAEAARLRQQLKHAEWVADYESAPAG